MSLLSYPPSVSTGGGSVVPLIYTVTKDESRTWSSSSHKSAVVRKTFWPFRHLHACLCTSLHVARRTLFCCLPVLLSSWKEDRKHHKRLCRSTFSAICCFNMASNQTTRQQGLQVCFRSRTLVFPDRPVSRSRSFDPGVQGVLKRF